MKDRLSRIFNRNSGNTVMLAFDHGYTMGPTSGLERMDLTRGPGLISGREDRLRGELDLG
jgi:DhnA family fructose-bisphosphate aldolase class Ia